MSSTMHRSTMPSSVLRPRPLRRLVVPAAALAVALGLAGCGNNSSDNGSMPAMGGQSQTTPSSPSTGTGTPATGAHNPSDVGFATQMIPHHQQAVMMANLAATRAANARVKDLAVAIKAAQGPEITRMSGWLTGWNAPAPTASTMSGGMSGGMGGHDMNGMMSDQDMQKMGAMSGADFDKAFLTGMLAHHRGAVAMAGEELRQGVNPEAKQLAQQIATSQTGEIAAMEGLLTQLGG